jgi:hypothetical protein
MIFEQLSWNPFHKWQTKLSQTTDNFNPQLVFVFGSRKVLAEIELIKELQARYPLSQLIGCSTSGEIIGTEVNDNSLAVTAIFFEKTMLQFSFLELEESIDSFKISSQLVTPLISNSLRHLLVLSDGLNVNGSELVRGFRELLPDSVSLTGGLAGDGSDFVETFVFDEHGIPRTKLIAAIGFYGDSIQVGYGSFGGWDSFGIDRKITKSEENVLFEIDGVPALELYKSFLGDKASELPGSGLLFPLSLRTEYDQIPVVRTILSINEMEQSITFAGDMTEGAYVKFMKANVDRLINGSIKAAQTSIENNHDLSPEFALLISCVGRKLVLKQLVEEEVEAASQILGKETVITGFYSYGEISPFSSGAQCELHNQTMTITTFSER